VACGGGRSEARRLAAPELGLLPQPPPESWFLGDA
jgi:hypothetical protein